MTGDRTPDGAPHGPAGPTDDDATDLAARLVAEQAAVAYWRDVARQRRIDAATVQRRPVVRAAIAADRRTRTVQDAAGRGAATVRATGRRVRALAAGLRARRELAERRALLDAQVARATGEADDVRAAVAASPPRRVLLLHLGPPPAAPAGGHPLTTVAVPHGEAVETSRAIDRIVTEADADVVALLGPTTEPLVPGWLDACLAALHGDVVAAAPLVVHPQRPWTSAGAHDLLVRAEGVVVRPRADGAPVAVAHHEGSPPDLGAPGQEVAAASGAAAVVDRAAWLAAGGLGTAPDLDAAVFDLCTRLRRHGGRVVSVPAGAVVDHRPEAGDAAGPLAPDGTGWRSLVDDHGAELVRAPGPSPRAADEAWRIALTTATPSRKIAPRSGDWHYAGLFAAALRRAGHEVRQQTIDEADSLAGRAADLHVVLRGLEPVRRTAGQRHVLWIISHPEAVEVAECDAADLVVVASHRYAAHLRHLTTTPVEVLLQATEPRRLRPVPVDPAHRHPVTVVANTRGVRRAAVADALAAGLTPAVHGLGWEGLVAPELICTTYAGPEILPAVYASASVVLNDHWDTMRHWGFVSNRVFDVAACGTPVVSDHLPEIVELFGDLVPTWQTPEELGRVVRSLLGDPEAAAARADALRDLVLASHTFDHRVVELAALLVRHGLGPDGAERAPTEAPSEAPA